jgi:hypothetical protein
MRFGRSASCDSVALKRLCAWCPRTKSWWPSHEPPDRNLRTIATAMSCSAPERMRWVVRIPDATARHVEGHFFVDLYLQQCGPQSTPGVTVCSGNPSFAWSSGVLWLGRPSPSSSESMLGLGKLSPASNCSLLWSPLTTECSGSGIPLHYLAVCLECRPQIAVSHLQIGWLLVRFQKM